MSWRISVKGMAEGGTIFHRTEAWHVAAWQEHLEELNIRKNQLEDAEIIKSIRSMKLGSREMLAFLENIRNGAVPAQQGQHIGEARQEEIMPGEAENIREPEEAPAEREDREDEENG